MSRSASSRVERRQLGRPVQQRLHLGGEPHVVLGVRAAHGRGIRLELEARGGDLAHRHEHREERHAGVVVLAQQAAVDELEERAEQVGRPWRAGRDRLDGVEAEVAGEHAEAHEQRPRVGAEQVDAPLDRRLDRALALGHVARARSRAAAAPGRAVPSIAAGVRARMRAAASSIASGTPSSARQMRATSSAFSVGHLEPGIGGPRAVAEQPHGRGLEDRSTDRPDGVGRQAERLDVEDLLAAHAQPRATRHEERRVGQVGQQRHDVGRGVEHLLEVVEHDEVAPAGARDAQLLG